LNLTNWQESKLPKWQAAGPNCQNGSHSKSCAKLSAKLATANIVPNKIFFSSHFFFLRGR
jgi:hypothetical protein